MNYQQYPTQPGQQPQPGMYPPPQPKKMGTGAKVGIGCGGAFAALLVIGIIGAVVGGGAGEPAKVDKVAAAPKHASKGNAKQAEDKPKTESKPRAKPAAPKSAVDKFKAFVAKNGTATEKAAAQHITKVQGADEQNDILDSVDIYTDYTGGIMGPHAADGKLIASAFADWKNSKNGLVTIYDKAGEILSNGNF
ncbi:hypothetical protein ACIRPT_03155 [Streptomyces sp. NPDC101227]|uniref:hypothetical protein n=1 Tax=Streptomyces sp. NPDC101227 TaxID=3366136 RepID=UPI0037FCC37C